MPQMSQDHANVVTAAAWVCEDGIGGSSPLRKRGVEPPVAPHVAAQTLKECLDDVESHCL